MTATPPHEKGQRGLTMTVVARGGRTTTVAGRAGWTTTVRGRAGCRTTTVPRCEAGVRTTGPLART